MWSTWSRATSTRLHWICIQILLVRHSLATSLAYVSQSFLAAKVLPKRAPTSALLALSVEQSADPRVKAKLLGPPRCLRCDEGNL